MIKTLDRCTVRTIYSQIIGMEEADSALFAVFTANYGCQDLRKKSGTYIVLAL